jgi:hypothetical protein
LNRLRRIAVDQRKARTRAPRPPIEVSSRPHLERRSGERPQRGPRSSERSRTCRTRAEGCGAGGTYCRAIATL